MKVKKHWRAIVVVCRYNGHVRLHQRFYLSVKSISHGLLAPVSVLLQIRFDARHHTPFLALQSPRLVDMSRWDVRVLETLAFNLMCQTSCIVVSRICHWIMIPGPSSNSEEANCCILAILLDGLYVGIVKFFPVQEARLLEDAYSFESVFSLS